MRNLSSPKIVKVLTLFCAMGMGTPMAHALPALQLDIGGGFYGTSTETILTTSDTFTLYALLDPTKISAMDRYYISAALSPQTTSLSGVGSFSLSGPDLLTASVWSYGVPPLEGVLSTFDAGDLSKHGVFPTYFQEFSFTFNQLNTSGIYNTQDNPGGIQSGTGLLYAAFEVDKTLLNSPYQLHFDLYSESVRNGDIDVNKFAPFSHDAGTTSRVPEPSSALLLGIGLVGVALWQRRNVFGVSA